MELILANRENLSKIFDIPHLGLPMVAASWVRRAQDRAEIQQLSLSVANGEVERLNRILATETTARYN